MSYFRIGEDNSKPHPKDLGTLFKISNEQLRAFYLGVPRGFGLSCFTVVLEWTTYKQSELTPERNLTVSIDKGLKERHVLIEIWFSRSYCSDQFSVVGNERRIFFLQFTGFQTLNKKEITTEPFFKPLA